MAATCRDGHLRNHLTNALDGSQDEMGGGEAHKQLTQLNMARARAETMQRVDDAIAKAGEARWDLIRDL
eukprot:6587324-Alexandrium_andersonii.AAC.1